MGSTRQKTCANGNWNVGTLFGSGIDGVQFQPFQRMSNGKYRRPACYGKIFATQEAANAYALEHGFSQIYFARPSAFIKLRLSPATRRYLKAITNPTARWDALEKILGFQHDGGTYLRGIRSKPYAAKTRAEWNLYLDGDFEQLRQLRSGELAYEAVKQILGNDLAHLAERGTPA